MAHQELFGRIESPADVEAYLNAPDNLFPIFTASGAELLRTYEKKDTNLWDALLKCIPGWMRGAQGIGDCFIAGTAVTMSDGTEKPIERVRPGDMVLSHTGVPRRVLDTLEKKFSGDLVTIEAKGYGVPLTATPDHRFVNYPGIPSGRMAGPVKSYAPAWKPAGELQKNDRVLLTKPQLKDETFSWAVDCPRKQLVLNSDLGRLIGIYMAEGGLSKYRNGKANRIDLSLGRHEGVFIEETRALISACFGTKTTIGELPSKPSVTMVRTSHVGAAQWLQALIPGNLYTKRLPGCVFRSGLHVRLAVLRGWIDGDGHSKLAKAKGGWSLQLQGTSANPGLCRDMMRLALSCGLKPALRQRKPRKNRKQAADVFLFGNDACSIYPELRAEAQAVMTQRGLQTVNRSRVEHGVAAPIAKISRQAVTDVSVYCLEVETDHSFVANGYGVHNCVSWGLELAGTMLLAKQFVRTGRMKFFLPCATESLYGGSRVEVYGIKAGGWQDGANGARAAEFARRYGFCLRKDYSAETGVKEHDLRKYDANKAKQWGNYGCGGQMDGGKLDSVAKQAPVKATTLVTCFDDIAASIAGAKCPVTIASNYGTDMVRDKFGQCKWNKTWPHQMLIGAVRFGSRPAGRCFQSWGPKVASGGEDSNEEIPENVSGTSWWIPAEDLDKICKQGDSHAIGDFAGWKIDPYDYSSNFNLVEG